MTIADPSSATTPSLPQATLTHWRNGVFTIFGICGFLLASWVSRIPTVRDLLGASTQEMGILILAVAVGAVTGLLASGPIVARFGATATIRVAYVVCAAGIIGVGMTCALAPSFPALFVCLLFFGGGNSITDVAMNVSGAANERTMGRNLMPLFHGVFSLGTVAGAGFGALMELLDVPVLAHLVGVGIAAIAANLVLVRFLHDTGRTARGPVPLTWRERLAPWRTPRVVLIGLIVLGMAFAEGSANDWLSLAMVDGHHVSNAAGAATFGVFVAAMTIGRFSGPLVLGRYGRVTVLRASGALAVVGVGLVILVPLTAVAVVGVVLWGLGAALGFPVGMSAAADDPQRAAANVSAVATIGYIAFLIGPPVIGFLGQRIGLLYALSVVLVLVLVATLSSGAARPAAPVDR